VIGRSDDRVIWAEQHGGLPIADLPILPKENMRWTQTSGVGYALITGCKAAL
jgi:hypothetical protein